MSKLALAKNILSEYVHLTEEYEELILKMELESNDVKDELNPILNSMTKEEVDDLFNFLEHDSDIKYYIFYRRKELFSAK